MTNKKNLTENEILEMLPLVADRNWRITTRHGIRDENNRCPLCALANEIDPKFKSLIDGYKAIDYFSDSEFSTNWVTAQKIMYAADYKNSQSDLRKQMIELLGIQIA